MIDVKRKKKKKKKSQWPFILIFILGLLVLLYPQVSRLYYRIDSKNVISNFDSEKEKLSTEEIKRRMELAKAFNESLHNVVTEDPYSDEKKKEGRAEYARMLEINEYIGHIQIPIIDVDVPMYAGTSEEVLQKGAGHLEGSSLPIGGINTHTVITAHSGLPTAKLFTDLSKVQIGDTFYIHNFAEILAYQVDQIKVIEPSEFDDLLIVKDKDYATLLTCTPYMINSHRLLVRGHRVEYVKELVDREILEGKQNMVYMYLFYFAIFVVIILIILTVYFVLKKRRLKKKLKNFSIND
ncbi:MAG: class C sortase [Parvimonas sp.]|uniref:class C sortase n=1 Tax=Parvimonas sp. TaxID=1944660 RepID=UPI0025D42658|nr:class C sortase [Parvimonas sp.]MCI5997988.1 class C sortase [Parvimonas sp.]MDY3051364.1 class C sortase [Parvimonas sp.]